MRNLKKFLALVLATLMMVSAAAVVSADFTDVAADNRYAEAINDLAVKGIVKGTTETTFAPTADVTRTQMAIFLARTLSGETEDDARWAKGIVPYTDVTEYAGAIEYVQVKGLINGWTDINGKLVFGPKDNVTYVQALKMALGALGYTEELAWPWGYYNKAVELGLTYNMDVSDLNAELNRAETAQVIYNVLYAEPAEGELTLAEANFGIATANNTSLFVITATPKQFYAYDDEWDNYGSNSSEVEGDYVGIQALVNGIPDGSMIYVPTEKLGIALADVENYFNYAVELVNFDADTKDFDAAILGEAPVVLTNKDVSVANTTTAKMKVKGVTYTTVEEITGATLNNEIVLYNGAAKANKGVLLVVDEDGYVYTNDSVRPVGKVAYTSTTGATYYIDYASEKIISQEKALDKWGFEVLDEAGAFVEYETMNAGAMYDDAYQIALYDDDRDGLYERAVYNPIYMAVNYTYKAVVDGKDTVCDGIAAQMQAAGVEDFGTDDQGVPVASMTYTDDAAKEYGAISVFTYNAQLNKVNVIDVLEVKTGTVDKVSASGYRYPATDGNNTVKLTIDGTAYTLAYDFEEVCNNAFTNPSYATMSKYVIRDAVMGARILTVENAGGYTLDELGEEAFLELFGTNDTNKADIDEFIDTVTVDMDVAFVEYNGYILMINEVETEELYNFAVVEDWSDFDLGEIYMDLWVAGEIEEDATVTYINGYDLADLSTTKFSLLLSKDELFWPGNIYSLDVVDGNYELVELIDEDNYDVDYDLINAKVADDNYTAYADEIETNGKVTVDNVDYTNVDDIPGIITFDNGNTATTAKADKLRTNDDTIFYFITKVWDNDVRGVEEVDEYDREVKVWTGDVADELYIKYDKYTQIWTDSIGVGEDRATVVFVIDPVEQNFFASDVTFVIGGFRNQHQLEVDYAEDLGLPEEYEGEKMYVYIGNYYDIYTNEKVATTIYSTTRFKDHWGNSGCYINEDNIICDATGDIDKPAIFECVNIPGRTGLMQYLTADRDYAKYGITNRNSDNATNTASSGWGVADGKLNYYDWLYAKETKKYELPDNADYKFPKTINEVDLIDNTRFFDMEWDEDVLKNLDVKIDGTWVNLINKTNNDDIEVVAIPYANANAVSGEAAYEIIWNAPQVYIAMEIYQEGGETVYDISKAVEDGVLEIYVLTTTTDK